MNSLMPTTESLLVLFPLLRAMTALKQLVIGLTPHQKKSSVDIHTGYFSYHYVNRA
jgi:hypothetical protein